MEIKIDFEEECPRCHGSGRTFKVGDRYEDGVPCTRCKGSGVIPTDEGLKLLDFLSRKWENVDGAGYVATTETEEATDHKE